MNDNNYSSTSTEAIKLEVTASDGQNFSIAGSKELNETKYSIKKLNSRIFLDVKGNKNMNDIFTTQAKICSSSKDILMFRGVLTNTNNEHIFTMSAMMLAQLSSVTRSSASKFIKRCINEKLLIRSATNIYFVNPFLFTPVGSRAELIEKAQLKWRDIEFKNDLENPEFSGLADTAQELIDKYELTEPASILMNNEFFLSILDRYDSGSKLTDKQIDGLIKAFS